MLPVPTKFTMVASGAEGATTLNAFDNALLGAGIGNLNLVRISSILPPGAVEVPQLQIAPGTLVPTAYGSITSTTPGELIAAAVSVAISENDFGVIMEFSGKCSKDEAERTVAAMAEEAFRVRGMKLARLLVKGAEHRVVDKGCAFAAVALWY
ncbi:MAG: arginine decarboxylase, pyruvoyl-dependent [Bacillota bacterium]